MVVRWAGSPLAPHITFAHNQHHGVEISNNRRNKQCRNKSTNNCQRKGTKEYNEASLANEEEVVVVRMADVLVHHSTCIFQYRISNAFFGLK